MIKEQEAGNCAAMRHAIETAIADLQSGLKMTPGERQFMVRYLKDAIAEPPRNCDRFKTKEDAALAFADEMKQWIPQSVLWELAPWLDWLFATATKKGGVA